MAIPVSDIAKSRKAKAEALQAAGEILDGMGIPWWLEAGTCLGAIREGDFIGDDYDIDLGIPPGYDGQWDAIIAGFFKLGWVKGSAYRIHEGFRLRLCFRMESCSTQDSFAKSKKPTLDIFFFYEAGDKWWMGLHGPPPGAVGMVPFSYFYPHVFPRELFMDMKPIDFAGRKCLIPSPPEKYLAERYGEGWRKPQRDYRFWRDCKAIVSIDEWRTLVGKDHGLN